MRSSVEQSARQSARFLRNDTRAKLLAGKPVWEPAGRKVGTLKALSGPEPAGAQYSIICLGTYPKVGAGSRAIPNELLIYDPEMGGFSCRVSEMALLSSPPYSGAPDFLDERWRTRLREHYEHVATGRATEAEPETSVDSREIDQPGGGEELSSPYVSGDEIRRLDWRVLGRTDRPYIKEYDEETNLRCVLMLGGLAVLPPPPQLPTRLLTGTTVLAGGWQGTQAVQRAWRAAHASRRRDPS